MRPRPLPPELRGRAFSVGTARRCGVGDERLRRRDLVRPTRSIRWDRAHPPQGIDRIRAFRPVLLPGQFISHVSAAQLWELPVPQRHRDDERVHVTSVVPAGQMRRRNVVGHRVRSAPAGIRPRWGMPVSSPAATWAECGPLMSIDELVVLGDAVVASRACGTTPQELADELALRSGARGAARLRAALGLVRVGAESPQETRGRLAIVRAGLPEPRLQHVIEHTPGAFVARVDMAWPLERVIVEYEGDHHRTDAGQWGIDIRRHRTCATLGWTVLRWTKSDLTVHLAATMAELRTALGRRA